MPYEDFERTAKVLDRQRLGKQRVETLQIANVLASGRTTGGWVNHPAVRMWRGHLNGLITYGLVICDEWTARGYADTCRDKMLALGAPSDEMPPWMGDERVHQSHRSKLLMKFPDHYSTYFDDPDDLDYFWPV